MNTTLQQIDKLKKEATSIAKLYHIKLTRKIPNTNKTVSKGVGELLRETESRVKNWVNTPKSDRCYNPTIAIAEKVKHNGKPCKPHEERTKNFCIKKLAKVDEKQIKWERTLSPNAKTRITIVCPK